MKYSRLLLSVVFVFMTVMACNKETRLNVALEKPEQLTAKTPLEEIIKRFKDDYGVTVNYKWDGYAFDKDVNFQLSDPKDVTPYLELAEEVFFKAIEAVQEPNSDFVRKEIPIIFYLIGSEINYSGGNGSNSPGGEAAGQAGNIQPNRLTLGGLSTFGNMLRATGVNSDDAFLTGVFENDAFGFPPEGGLISFFYHEFTHYLNAKHGISVKKFKNRAYAEYRSYYSYIGLHDANSKGFMLPYGMQNEMEDFATYVQVMTWQPKDSINKNYLSRGDVIKNKARVVYDYFLKLGLDLYKLRDHIHSKEVRQRVLAIKKKYEPKQAAMP